MIEIIIKTTRSRARAMVDAMAHEHVSYTEEGQLVGAFLRDLDSALENEPCAHEWDEQPGEPPVDTCSRCGAVRE